MNKECKHYNYETRSSENTTKGTGSPSPGKPTISKKIWCDHPELIKYKTTIFRLECDGDINKCAIPHIWKK